MYRYRTARHDDYDGMLRVLETANMHHIPSEEVDELRVQDCFVCTDKEGTIVGMCSWKSIDNEECKTVLMAVSPEHKGMNIGHTLQTMRMVAAHWYGHDVMITNADRPDTITWYKKNFGYYEIGVIKKEHEFGLPDVHEWTTLETHLGEFFRVE